MKRIICFAVLVTLLSSAVFAISGFSYKKLENGLDVFMMENHSAPVVYIEIALKAGAIVQQPDTAGLFHLFEHMIFKGNTKYKSAAEVQRVLNDMGVSNWNGSTGDEFVNYYFTIPKDELEKGLEFWSYAIREPLIDAEELENEKKVVISEITGGYSDPSRQFAAAVNLSLFPKFPWQLDPSGSVKNVSSCTVEKLRSIQKQYYVPDNAALFIGGDIEPEIVNAFVNKYYGTWQKSTDSDSRGFYKQAENPCSNKILLVMCDPQVSPMLAQILMVYRGPDTATDVKSTYGADVYGSLATNPDGRFIKNLTEDPVLKIPGADYFSTWYQTKLSAGRTSFIAVCLEPENDLVNRVNHFYEKTANEEIPKMLKDKNYFSKNEFKKIKQQLKDSRLIDTETAQGFLTSLRFWWASAPAGYYFSYEDNINKTSKNDVNEFLKKYILNKEPVIAVKINPAVYEKQKQDFEKAGYTLITENNCFYWKNEELDFNSNSEYIKFTNQEIDITNEVTTASEKNNTEKLTKTSLKNGIPVYVQQNKGNRIQNLRIIVSGGVHSIPKEKQGLEDALFKMMCTGSKKYPHAKLETLLHEKNASISGYGRKDFAQLQMNCLDYYFDEVFDIFSDCFMNPSFEQKEFDKLFTEYNQDIQQRAENPESLLSNLMADSMFQNHPYELKAVPVKESIQNINIESIKQHLYDIHNSNRIFIVAAGNFNTAKLIKKLNKTVGKISSKEYIKTKIPPVEFVKRTGKAKCTASKNTCYNALAFEFPDFDSSDYFPACIACSILDEYLFNNVREKNGTCYSVWNGAYGAKVNFGYIFGIKINDLEKYKTCVKETLQTFALETESQIDKRLPGFKNSFINSTYAQQMTNAGIGSQICSSILFYGASEEYKKNIDKINAVNASDIKRVFEKYWLSREMSDFTVTE